jgi:hypothetical protein
MKSSKKSGEFLGFGSLFSFFFCTLESRSSQNIQGVTLLSEIPPIVQRLEGSNVTTKVASHYANQGILR